MSNKDLFFEHKGAIEAAAKEFQKQEVPCLLCGAPPKWTGVYFPEDAKAMFGVPDDMHSAVFYSMCEACHHKENAADLAEEKISLSMAVRNN